LVGRVIGCAAGRAAPPPPVRGAVVDPAGCSGVAGSVAGAVAPGPVAGGAEDELEPGMT
jgi:hypothetical protein